MNSPLRVIDLFAGCGGISLGFHRAGYRILGGIDYDPKSCITHTQNFFKEADFDRGIHLSPRDMTDYPPSLFMQEVLKSQSPENLVDVVIGGPPCQAFARIGRAKLREILEHPEAFLHDERADLFINFLEYVEFFKPNVVVMENVQDIMNFGGTNVAEEIASSLDDMGYLPQYTILNSVHYGVPQMRQRWFLVAFAKSLDIEPSFPVPTHHHSLPVGYSGAFQVAVKTVDLFTYQTSSFVAPPDAHAHLQPAVTAEEALSDLPPLKDHLHGNLKRGTRTFDTLSRYRSDILISDYARDMRTWPGFESDEGVYDHVIRYLPRDYKLFARMKPGDQYPQLYELAQQMFRNELDRRREIEGITIEEGTQEFKDLEKEYVPPYDPKKFPNKWRKMEADQPSRTLTAHIGKDTYSHIHYDSDQARVISVREAARLQSFPDGFKIEGPMNAAFRQIGNAVPPLLSFAIANHISCLLNGS